MMKESKRPLLLLLLLAVFTFSCTKSELLPEEAHAKACFSLDKLEVSTDEAITFTNCSEAKISFLNIYNAEDYALTPNNPSIVLENFDFNEDAPVVYFPTNVGRFVAEVFAQNTQAGSEIDIHYQEFDVTE